MVGVLFKNLKSLLLDTLQHLGNSLSICLKLISITNRIDRCGPCRAIAPVYEELANKHGESITFAKVDIDDASDVAEEMQIRSVPTFFFMKEGKMVSSFSGADSNQLLQRVDGLLK